MITKTCECVIVNEGRSRHELCEEWLIGKVCRDGLRARQWRAAAETTVRDAGTQEVERHMGDSSTGPTLWTEEYQYGVGRVGWITNKSEMAPTVLIISHLYEYFPAVWYISFLTLN